MKLLLPILSLLLLAGTLRAQDAAPPKAVVPDVYFINTNIVNDIESIPTVGFEKFFLRKDRLYSWLVDLDYQIHYSNQFGVARPHSDMISIGVYQGPGVRGGLNIYSHRHRKHWLNYCEPSLALKYLWYDSLQVNTGHSTLDQGYRIQSEKCLAVVPQFVIGAKHVNKFFCADFFIGVQLPVKFRDKTIYYEQNNNGIENTNVPYKSNVVNVLPGAVLGIKLGYLRATKHKTA